VGEAATSLAISASAHRLVYSRRLQDQNVWRIEVAGGKAGPPTRLIASTLRDFEPRYSPDGRRISYASDRSGHIEVWVADADGSNQVQLTDMKSSLTSGARWSPDGQRLVFLSVVGEQQELFTIAAGGGAVTRLTDNPAHDTAPSWSHDGKWIYFGSNRGGNFQLWKMPSRGGEAVQITKKGGYAPLESSDGQFLYYARRSPNDGIWQVPVAGGEETQVIPHIDTWGNFAVVDRGIYFVPPDKASIEFYEFATRQTKAVAKPGKVVEFGLTATADSRFVAYAQTDQDSNELMLVDNFR
jgi:Tol biopolymer transport system component